MLGRTAGATSLIRLTSRGRRSTGNPDHAAPCSRVPAQGGWATGSPGHSLTPELEGWSLSPGLSWDLSGYRLIDFVDFIFLSQNPGHFVQQQPVKSTLRSLGQALRKQKCQTKGGLHTLPPPLNTEVLKHSL